MQIRFHGNHTQEEALESVLGIFQLFQERYQIENFSDMNLSFSLVDEKGQEVEIIDVNTQEVLDVFEVYKTSQVHGVVDAQKPDLKLVVDNTK